MEDHHAVDHARAEENLEKSEKAFAEAIRRATADRGYRRQGRWLGRYFVRRAGERTQHDDPEGANRDYDEALRRNPGDPEALGHSIFGARFVEPERAIREAQ